MYGRCVFVSLILFLTKNGNSNPIEKVASISLDEVTFQLYTAEDAVSGTRIYTGDLPSVNATAYNPKLPTKVLIHGWMDELSGGFIQKTKKQFLLLEPMNIIALDWSACSHVLLYEQTIECAKQVGTFAGEMIQWLTEETGLSLDNVHVLGHSLGGQVISFVSRVVKVGRISSLDPAGPLFTHTGPENRLDPTDAEFVDVIHSSTKILGITFNVGHIDFYPNGGIKQPGCTNDVFGTCAHGVSSDLYIATILEANRNDYMAFKCTSVEEAQNQTCTDTPLAVMGYGATPGASGIYYIGVPEIPRPSHLEEFQGETN